MPNEGQKEFNYCTSLIELGRALLKSAAHQEAVFHLRHLVDTFPGCLVGYELLAEAHLGLRDDLAAVAVLRRAEGVDPENTRVQELLLEILSRNGEWQAVDTQLTRAEAHGVQSWPLLQARLSLLSACSRQMEAEHRLQQWLASHPSDDLARAYQVDFLLRQCRWQEVESALQGWATISPEAPLLFEHWARYWQAVGNAERCLAFCQKVLEKGDANPRVIELVASVLTANGAFADADRVVESVLQAQPAPELRTILVRLREAQGRVRPRGGVRDDRQIVFVTDVPRSRMVKMAFGLKAKGWDVVLLCQHLGSFDIRAYVREVRQYSNHEHALALAQEYAPRAFHVVSSMADRTAAAFVREKPGTVVFDPYDIVEGMIRYDSANEAVTLQRYCMEHADALCCRDLRSRYLARRLGYRLPEKRILFMDYCWNHRPIEKHFAADQEVQVVSGGYIATARHTNEADMGYLHVGRRLIEQGIHFHVYPHPLQSQSPDFTHIFSDFLDLQRQSPLFHVHASVPLDRMEAELSKYTLGINFHIDKLNKVRSASYTEAHFKYCSSSRNIEYLDAGLPLLTVPELHFQYALFRRYGLALPLSWDLLRDMRSRLRPFLADPTLTQRINAGRKALSLERHVDRLVQFYESL